MRCVDVWMCGAVRYDHRGVMGKMKVCYFMLCSNPAFTAILSHDSSVCSVTQHHADADRGTASTGNCHLSSSHVIWPFPSYIRHVITHYRICEEFSSHIYPETRNKVRNIQPEQILLSNSRCPMTCLITLTIPLLPQ